MSLFLVNLHFQVVHTIPTRFDDASTQTDDGLVFSSSGMDQLSPEMQNQIKELVKEKLREKFGQKNDVSLNESKFYMEYFHSFVLLF